MTGLTTIQTKILGLVGSVLVLALAGLAGLSSPANAAVENATTTGCLTGGATTSESHLTRAPDTVSVGLSQSKAIDAAMSKRVAAQERVQGRAATTPVTINVRAHIIKGTHTGDRYLTRANLDKTIAWMNQAYAGQAHAGAAATRFRFKLYSVDTTTNDRWYHASPQSAASKEMRRTLRVGHSYGLNLYFLHLAQTDGAATLGFSTFPWADQHYPHLDGVQINIGAVPGGWLPRYDSGDTVVHEVGHWLGLWHTFQNGCVAPGDSVSDTPYEAQPQYGCDTSADTCPQPGTDPVHNYMDYSLDSCMYEFTAGQATRMSNAFEAYRTR